MFRHCPFILYHFGLFSYKFFVPIIPKWWHQEPSGRDILKVSLERNCQLSIPWPILSIICAQSSGCYFVAAGKHFPTFRSTLTARHYAPLALSDIENKRATILQRGYAVTQLVEALCYKTETFIDSFLPAAIWPWVRFSL